MQPRAFILSKPLATKFERLKIQESKRFKKTKVQLLTLRKKDENLARFEPASWMQRGSRVLLQLKNSSPRKQKKGISLTIPPLPSTLLGSKSSKSLISFIKSCFDKAFFQKTFMQQASSFSKSKSSFSTHSRSLFASRQRHTRQATHFSSPTLFCDPVCKFKWNHRNGTRHQCAHTHTLFLSYFFPLSLSLLQASCLFSLFLSLSLLQASRLFSLSLQCKLFLFFLSLSLNLFSFLLSHFLYRSCKLIHTSFKKRRAKNSNTGSRDFFKKSPVMKHSLSTYKNFPQKPLKIISTLTLLARVKRFQQFHERRYQKTNKPK